MKIVYCLFALFITLQSVNVYANEKNEVKKSDKEKYSKYSNSSFYYFPSIYVSSDTAIFETIFNGKLLDGNYRKTKIEFIFTLPLPINEGPLVYKDYYLCGFFYGDYTTYAVHNNNEISTSGYLKIWPDDFNPKNFRITPYIVPIRTISVNSKRYQYSYFLPGVDIFYQYKFIAFHFMSELHSYKNLSSHRLKAAVSLYLYKSDFAVSPGIDTMSWKNEELDVEGKYLYKYIKLKYDMGSIFTSISLGLQDIENDSGTNYKSELNFNLENEKIVRFELGLGGGFF